METLRFIAVPAFISCIALEAFLNAKGHLDHYEKKDTMTNVGIALIGIVVNLVVKSIMFSFYTRVASYAFLHPGNGILAWIVLFLLTDLQFYLFHVLGHRSRFFWAFHVIHHSSHKYNFTTAFRTPFTNACFRFASLTPLVLLGFTPMMVLWVNSLIITITFFQHTELIRKLGWLERVFNTPSHHRVHHGRDEKYLDKNFGGVLIIWDKLLGTFQSEDEPPTYGITKPLTDQGIVNVVFHEWKDIFRDLSRYHNWVYRFKLLFGRPGWQPGPLRSKTKWRAKFPHVLIVKAFILILLFLTLSLSVTHAQRANDLVQLGIDCERRSDDKAALSYYEQAILAAPSQPEGYWRASRMLSNFAGRNRQKSVKMETAQLAHQLAKRAVELDPQNMHARLAHIISLGLLSEVADSPSDKLRGAKIIRSEAETILKIDSLCAPAYYVLGKWHFELAKLSWLEKLACNMLFGGVPKDVSFAKSIFFFERAIALQPDYILFRYGKACTLYQIGKYEKVVGVLEDALKLPPVDPDDKVRKDKCLKLLNESKLLSEKNIARKSDNSGILR